MSKIKSIFFIGVLIFCSSAWSKDPFRVGVLTDGVMAKNQLLVDRLRRELTALLGAKYEVEIPEKMVLSSNWSVLESSDNYARLVADKSVDVIVAAGVMSSSTVLQSQNYPKPVIAIGVIDHRLLKLNAKGASGTKNLSYILYNHSISKDLEELKRLLPYRRIAIVADRQLLKFVLNKVGQSAEQFFATLNGQSDTELVFVPLDSSLDNLAQVLSSVDAVYLSYMGELEGEIKTEVIRLINEHKVPSFGSSVTDVEMGVLAAVAPKQPLDKIIRRLALNIEAITEGVDPADLPAHITFEERLTINLDAAENIGFSPPFDVYSEADIISSAQAEPTQVLTLKKAIELALVSNLSIAIEKSRVKSSELDVELAKSKNYPSVSFNATGTHIDEDRADASFGQQAEKTSTGAFKLQQLIFSEAQNSNVDIQSHLLSATEFGLEQQKLDVVLDTAAGYFSVLKAKTGQRTQSENVKLTRQNLAIAKQREAVGFSGISDVYFWKSQLATATTDHLAAINQYNLSKLQFNQLLNHKLDDKVTLQDSSMAAGVYESFLSGETKTYVDTPAALKKFTRFLVLEAMSNSPEVMQIDASINAQERRFEAASKKQFLPDVSLVAEKQEVFSRGGVGSDVPGVELNDEAWSASVNFSWSLYEGGAISADRRQALREISLLKDQRLQLQQSLELQVRSALLDLVTQAVNLKSSQRSADFSAKSLQLVQESYSQGEASIAELSEAQKTAVVADQKSLNAIYDYLLAVLTTERAVGKFSLLRNAGEQKDYVSRLKHYFTESKKSEEN